MDYENKKEPQGEVENKAPLKEESGELEVYEPEQDYSLHLNMALTITLAFFIIMLTSIKVEVKPYKPRKEVAVMTEEVSTEVEQMQEEINIPKPKLPVQVEEAEQGEEATDLNELEGLETSDFNELAAPPPPKTDTAIDFYAVEIKPKVIKRVEPEYPDVARRAGLEGDVFVLLVVDENGNVISAQIVKSTNPIFNDAALKAVKQWKFKPGYQRDKPVKVRLMQPIHFRLTR